MERAIRLLMLEDTPEDVTLIQRVLKQADLKLEINVVSTRESFIQALDSFSPELILSDHQLPNFSSNEALEISRQKLPYVGFILVTGAVSEEFAASIIRSDADDYLLKSNLKRLPTAIIQANEKRRTQESLRKSEAHLRTIFNTTETGFVLLDKDCKLLSFNPLFGEIAKQEYGFDLEEGMDIMLITQPHRQAIFRGILDQVLSGETIEYELEYSAERGIWYYYRFNPVRQANNFIIGVMGTITDISPRKKAEDVKRKTDQELIDAHKRIVFHIENTPLGFIEWDNEYRVKSWSKRAEEIFGWTEKEFIESGKTGFSMVYEEDKTRLTLGANQFISGEIVKSQIQSRNYKKDGSIIWCEWFNSSIKDQNGKVITVMSLVQDITERKTIENVLREYNDRFEILSRATNDAIWDWDIVKDINQWNHGIQTIFGYLATDVNPSKQWWRSKIHPADHDRVNSEIEEAFSSHAANWSSEYQYQCSDGSYRHVLDRAYIIYDHGKAVRMIGAIQDISENITASQEIEKLSLVASHTQNSVLITDPEGKLVWLNNAFTILSGYTLEEVVGKRPGSFLQGPETDPSTVARISRKLKRQEAFSEDIINYSKNGRKYWLRIDISPVFNDKKILTHFIAVQNDVSQQKEFENQLTNIARELTNLIQNANVPIFGVDRNGYINEWNRVATELSGYTKNEVLGKKWVNFLDLKVKSQVEEVLQKANGGEPTSNFELPFVNKEGKNQVLLISVTPRANVDKDINGIICVGQDVTEVFTYRAGLEKMVEERTRELHEALQKEKVLVEMKSKFVSIASHEFRTPLSTISFAAESIRNYFHQLSAAEIQRKLIKIEDQASHMTNLLEDILTIGKSEAGKIKVKRISLDLEEFINSLIEEVRSTSKDKREIVLHFSCENKKVNADDKLLRNVIVNLLTNAIKFSPASTEVTISVSDYRGNVLVEVTDRGMGIDPSELQSIFEPFQRASNANTVPGTGLGLSILKKAIELMDGSIQVASELNVGSTFKVEIPMR
ncbi:MAG: PAS domain S-box protein [Cyclobacteriaceae bacterium]|nr:PAS domain S-box protein [Cyclobacteriaceae bacterium]